MSLCYKDKTFCASDCTRSDCYRFLSEEDKQNARKWWSHDPDNAPIAMCDYSADCFWYKPKEAASSRLHNEVQIHHEQL